MKICCLGDSLTEGDYGVFGKKGIANVQKESYPFFLEKLSGAEVKNFGKCGYTATTYLEYYNSGAVDLTGTDIVLILLGTNGGLDPVDHTPGNNDYLELIQKTKELCTIPVIASINCYKSDAWIEFARQIELAGADALELNVFFLETNLTYNSENMRDLYVSIIRKVKETVSIPVMIKMSKMVGNIPAVAHTLTVNGADGIVLFNRFYQPDIDINNMQIVSGNVFSNHSDLSDTLRWTAIVSGKIPGISIASSTGVHDWEDVIKCLLAGADAIQMCSAVYTHGAEIISQVLTCIEEWMHQAHYQSLDQFKGKLNYANISNPAMYERSQFMKYFSNRD